MQLPKQNNNNLGLIIGVICATVAATLGLVFVLTSTKIINNGNIDLPLATYFNGKKIENSPNIIQKRPIANFDSIVSNSSFDINLVENLSEIEINGNPNIIDLIKTEVKDSILTIESQPFTFGTIGFDLRKKTEINIPLRPIKSIQIEGSGNIKSNSILKLETLDLQLNGSGDVILKVENSNMKTTANGSGNISLTGITQNHKLTVTGSGDIQAFELNTKNTEVKSTGSGDVNIFASENLVIEKEGSGEVNYKGSPVTKKSNKTIANEIKSIE